MIIRPKALVLIIAAVCSLGCGKSKSLDKGTRIDKIVIVKSDRTMSLMSGEHVVWIYKVALGRTPWARRHAKEITGLLRVCMQ